MHLHKPIVWTIAGSDSGGGAGIQADLKTINQLGAHGASVIAALTAQNTQGVSMVEAVSPAMISAQLKALTEDLAPQAIKLGMLYSAATVRAVLPYLTKLKSFVVCDPVMIATSGDDLALPDLIGALKQEMIPASDLVTPNLEEAHALAGTDFGEFKKIAELEKRDAHIEALAAQILKFGCGAVLVKGGSVNSEFSQDFWTNGKQSAWLTSRRFQTRNTHGTGCTLSSAIAAAIALGYDQLDAIVVAKAYVNQGLRTSPNLGSGQGPMSHGGWPECEEDLPWLTQTAVGGRTRLKFPDCGQERLGFYPIVDSYQWLTKLLPLGVRTAQLRIKALSGTQLEEEIKNAVELARQYDCRLFINDYWELAVRFNAYGVHLGQEDLLSADIRYIEAAGLRLGISTHCYSEVARALTYRPSYIAIGPVHATTTKEMKFKPQGIEALKLWRRSLTSYPLVAIGGMFLENAREAIDAGVNGIAIVRDIVQAPSVVNRVREWLMLLPYSA